MSDSTRTGPLVGKLVEGIQADLADAVEQLQGGLAKMRALEGHTKGVNGLSATLKARGNEVAQIIDVLSGESESVARKMLGTGTKDPITERLNIEHATAVVAARSA